MSHTPGPWYFQDRPGCKNIGPAESGMSRKIIRSIAQTDGVNEVEDRDNARLIAAAPDLLAALEALFTAVKNIPELGYVEGWITPNVELQTAYDLTTAALKRVQG